MLDQCAYIVISEPRVNIETHVRELNAYVGIQAARGDFRKQLTIELRAVPGLVGGRHIFAEIINGNAEPCVVQRLGDAQSIFHLSAGNEAA